MGLTTADFLANIDAFQTWQLKLANHRPSGVAAAILDLRLCGRYLATTELEQIDGPALLGFISHLRQVRENSPASVNRKISSLKTYWRFLRFMEVSGADSVPIRELPRICVPYRGPVQTLSLGEIQRLFKAIDQTSSNGFRDFTVYSLMYRLGLRIGEVHNLNVEDADLVEGELTVRGKGGKTRIMPLVPDMLDLLRQYLAVRARFYSRSSKKLTALFLSQKGNRLAVRTMEDNFRKLVRRSGQYSIDKVTPHTLRHAFATHAVEHSSCRLVTLKAVMGHARLASTEIYLHPSRKMQRQAVNAHVSNEILSDLSGPTILGRQQKWKAG